MANDRLSWPSSAASFTDELQARLDALAEGDQLLLVFADSGSVDIQHADREYIVALDTGYDLTFATDISAMIDAAQWHLGMYDPGEIMAPPLQCTLTLSDPSGRFSRDRAQATNDPLGGDLIGVMLRIQVILRGELITLMTGWVSQIKPAERVYGYVTEIEVTDKMAELQNHDYAPEVRQRVRLSDEIQTVFDKISVSYPYERDFWILGASRLGVDTKVHEADVVIEQSRRILNWAGDASDRGDGVSAHGYIQDLVAAELGGRFFTNRDGRFVFHARYRHLAGMVSRTFDDSEIDEFLYEQSVVYNTVTVRYYPRDIGSPRSVIYTLENVPLSVAPQSTHEFTAKFYDTVAEDSVIAAIDIVPTELIVDFDAGPTAERPPNVRGGRGGVAVRVRASANEAEVQFLNSSNVAQYVRHFQIRGTPLRNYQAEEVQRADAQSIFDYGVREFPFADFRMIDSADYAEAFAKHALYRTARQRSDYPEIGFDIGDESGARDAFAADVLRLTIGDTIRLHNRLTGHNEIYAIIGEEHQLSGVQHHVRWVLRRDFSQQVWRLGVHQLGVDTTLAL